MKKLNPANVISICSNNWKQNVFFYSWSKCYLWSSIYDFHKWPDRRRSKAELNDLSDDFRNMSRIFPCIHELFMKRSNLHLNQRVLKVWGKKRCLQWELNLQHWPLLDQKSNAFPIVPTRHVLRGRPLTEFVWCTISHFGLGSFLESFEHDFIKVLKIQTYTPNSDLAQ